PDLLYSAQMVYARTYQTVPLLLVATIWYLALTTILTLVEHAVEQRLKSEHSAAANKNKGWILPFRLFARQQEAL
ncbi:MAG: amino acid ABC transporter permease, partial [Mesorhizobium sp.]